MPNSIRMLVAFDSQLPSDPRFSSPNALDEPINFANQIYRNSGVDQEIVLAGRESLTLTSEENAALLMMIMNYRGDLAATTSERMGDELRAMAAWPADQADRVKEKVARIFQTLGEARKTQQADFIVFWGQRTSGTASGARDIGAEPADAWISLPDSAMMNGFTLAHELGHLQGLRHEDGAVFPFRSRVPGTYTVMASGTTALFADSGNKVGLPYFSNPEVDYRDSRTGKDYRGEKYVWDEAAKLNRAAIRFAAFGERIYANEPRQLPDWPGSMVDVSFGDQGELWGVDSAGNPWQWEWEAVNWVKWPLPDGTTAAQVASGSPGNVWCRDVNGRLWRREGTEWRQPIRHAWGTSLSVGKDGSAWHVGGQQTLWRWAGTDWVWERSPLDNVQIAVGWADKVWRLDSAGRIFKWVPSGWYAPSNSLLAKDISVGNDGTVMIINMNDEIQVTQNDGTTWQSLAPTVPNFSPPGTTTPPTFPGGLKAKQISVADRMHAVKLNADGLWKQVTTEGDWTAISWGHSPPVAMNRGT